MSECGFGIWFYCVDWASTGAMLGGLGALLGAVAVLLAADNFRKWAEREKFKYNRDASVRILANFYEAEFALSNIRAPFVSAGELAQAENTISDKVTHLDEQTKDRWIMRGTLFNRIIDRNDTFEKIFQSLPLAKAVFGETAYNALFTIIRVRQKIYAAIDIYPMLKPGDFDVTQVIFRRDNPDSAEAIRINEMLDEARTELERLTEPYTSP